MDSRPNERTRQYEQNVQYHVDLVYDDVLVHLERTVQNDVWSKDAATWDHHLGSQGCGRRIGKATDPAIIRTWCPPPPTGDYLNILRCVVAQTNRFGRSRCDCSWLEWWSCRWSKSKILKSLFWDPWSFSNPCRKWGLAAENWWTSVEVESDSKVVINQIKGGAPRWQLRTLLVNISTTASLFDRVTWKEISRAANECANWIAKHARMSVHLDNWVSRPLLLLLSKACIVEISWLLFTVFYFEK